MSCYPSHAAFADKYTHYVDVIIDPKLWANDLFTDDATFVIGNFPVAIGREQIALGAQGIYDVTRQLKHSTTAIYTVSENSFITEGSVTYTLGETRLDPIPLMAFFELTTTRDDMKIKNYRAYINVDPLFIAAGLDITAGADGKPTMLPRKS